MPVWVKLQADQRAKKQDERDRAELLVTFKEFAGGEDQEISFEGLHQVLLLGSGTAWYRMKSRLRFGLRLRLTVMFEERCLLTCIACVCIYIAYEYIYYI